jgi:hypothetical protein
MALASSRVAFLEIASSREGGLFRKAELEDWQKICSTGNRVHARYLTFAYLTRCSNMSRDIRGSLLWDDESALEDEDTSWDDDQEFDVTDEDCEVMESVGWEPDDLPSDRDKDRYRQYLTKKQ